MKRLRLLLGTIGLVLLTAAGGALAAQQIGWEDLTIPVDPSANPYTDLPFDHQMHLEQIAYIASLRNAGETIDERLAEMERSSRDNMEAAGLDADALLEQELAFVELLEKAQSTIREDLDGRDIRIPGYMLPMEWEGTAVKEFLLVPFVGACIHTPPPPPNQIIYVVAKASFPMRELFEPVWVSGRMSTITTRQSVDLSDGTSEFDVGYQIEASDIEIYAE